MVKKEKDQPQHNPQKIPLKRVRFQYSYKIYNEGSSEQNGKHNPRYLVGQRSHEVIVEIVLSHR